MIQVVEEVTTSLGSKWSMAEAFSALLDAEANPAAHRLVPSLIGYLWNADTLGGGGALTEQPATPEIELELGNEPDGNDCRILAEATKVRLEFPSSLVNGLWLEPFLTARFCHTRGGSRFVREFERLRQSNESTYFNNQLVAHKLGQWPGRHSGRVTSSTILDELRIPDHAYLFPLWILCLTSNFTAYAPELVGCAACMTGILTESRPGDREDTTPRNTELKDIAVSIFDDDFDNTVWKRVVDGSSRTRRLRRLRDLAVRTEIARTIGDPTWALEQVVLSKWQLASRAHGAATLGTRTLDSIFGGPPEPTALLDRLAQSEWVIPGSPEQSEFITKLTVGPHSPMGTVFSFPELATFRRWIRTLTLDHSSRPPIAKAPTNLAGHQVEVGSYAPPALDPKSLNARTLFHKLFCDAERSAVLQYARAYVESWLGGDGPPPEGWHPLPPKYSHENLSRWFVDSYHRMIHLPEGKAVPPRELAEQRLWQNAPFELVDGSWLQHISRTRVTTGNVGRSLQSIYMDEIGNGNAADSHSNLYRRLLRQIQKQPPPLWSRDFAFDESLWDEAFIAPTYLLALSEHPNALLPEIVGTTLAIEFRALGTPALLYADMREAQLRLGSAFRRAHIWADNVVRGHSALTRGVIAGLMADAECMGLGDELWARVRRGVSAMHAVQVPLAERLHDCTEGPPIA